MNILDGNILASVKDVSGGALARFMSNIIGIKAALIASIDGFEIASNACEKVDTAKLSAVSSTLSAIGNMSTLETDIGAQYRYVTIDSEDGYLVIMNVHCATYPMILCVVASHEALLARVIQQAKVAVDSIINKLTLL